MPKSASGRFFLEPLEPSVSESEVIDVRKKEALQHRIWKIQIVPEDGEHCTLYVNQLQLRMVWRLFRKCKHTVSVSEFEFPRVSWLHTILGIKKALKQFIDSRAQDCLRRDNKNASCHIPLFKYSTTKEWPTTLFSTLRSPLSIVKFIQTFNLLGNEMLPLSLSPNGRFLCVYCKVSCSLEKLSYHRHSWRATLRNDFDGTLKWA